MTHRSLREIAAISGLSAGQISRLANGHSDRPTFDTAVRLAPALGIHPACLHVLAGHLPLEQGKQALRAVVETAAKGTTDESDLDALEGVKRDLDAAADPAALSDAAVVLVTTAVHGVDYPELDIAGPAPDVDLLAELVAAWPQLTPDRRWRMVELARDLQACSLRERRAASGAER
jgi:transcriptional regulator with XRE-family HTH domain